MIPLLIKRTMSFRFSEADEDRLALECVIVRVTKRGKSRVVTSQRILRDKDLAKTKLPHR
ncbi:hypothetical protein J6590_102706 [Homalodisca vitripennis]|nr:hypothetical protein J6590_102706 [Homalodisca vitripennis]